MTDIIIRRRGSLVYLCGQTVAGNRWIKTNIWMQVDIDVVVIQGEYLEYWISRITEDELTFEYN